jgi:hypothetical protein
LRCVKANHRYTSSACVRNPNVQWAIYFIGLLRQHCRICKELHQQSKAKNALQWQMPGDEKNAGGRKKGSAKCRSKIWE